MSKMTFAEFIQLRNTAREWTSSEEKLVELINERFDRTAAQPIFWLGVPELQPDTADLVIRFAKALAAKLREAEIKYQRSNSWMSPDWMDECRAELVEHVRKGDPRDVAAYCAFAWHHGWSTVGALEAYVQSDSPGRTDREIVDQTEQLAKELMLWAFNLEPVNPDYLIRKAVNSRGRRSWEMACRAQLLLTDTDVSNALDGIEDGPRRYTAERTRCDCHPETCCCREWQVTAPDGSQVTTFNDKQQAEVAAEAYQNLGRHK